MHKVISQWKWIWINLLFQWLDAPKIDKNYDSKAIPIGANFGILCLVQSGSLPLTFQWLRNGQVINDLKRIEIISIDDWSSKLSIINVSSIDSGNYTCSVRNSFGIDSHTVRLTVKGIFNVNQ